MNNLRDRSAPFSLFDELSVFYTCEETTTTSNFSTHSVLYSTGTTTKFSRTVTLGAKWSGGGVVVATRSFYFVCLNLR